MEPRELNELKAALHKAENVAGGWLLPFHGDAERWKVDGKYCASGKKKAAGRLLGGLVLSETFSPSQHLLSPMHPLGAADIHVHPS